MSISDQGSPEFASMGASSSEKGSRQRKVPPGCWYTGRPQFSGSGVHTRGMGQRFMNAIASFHVAYPAAIVIEHKKPKRR
jgi:hypothetical protein